MALPPTVEVYRWNDGRSIHRVLIQAGLPSDLLERQRKGPYSSTNLRLNVQNTPTYTVLGDPKLRDSEPFFFQGQEVEEVLEQEPHVLGLQIAQFPWGSGYVQFPETVKQIRRSILPFVFDLMGTKDRAPLPWDDVFGPGPEYLDDSVYDRLESYTHGVEELRAIFEKVKGAVEVSRENGRLRFLIYFLHRSLSGTRFEEGWSLSWLPGGNLSSRPTLHTAFQEAASDPISLPALLPVSRRAAVEKERDDLPAGTPTFNRSSLEIYRTLNLLSPLLWPPEEFYAWYQGQTLG